MAESAQEIQRWVGYPSPKEGPDVPFVRADDKNPAFRGWLFSVSLKLDSSNRPYGTNVKMNALRNIRELDEYHERYDSFLSQTIHRTTKSSDDLDIKSDPVIPEESAGRYRSVAEYHALYRTGKLTPLAVAESLLPLIRRDTSPPGAYSVAFTDSDAEEILEAAKASTLRYQQGNPLRYRSHRGRKRNDSMSGALIMGKLNMHELGADTTNNNTNWGTPKNPHNDYYYPGGSSGGPAYAVSSGLIPFALGSDGGGSIRIPSSFCGIYGLKPSHARVEDTGSTVTVNGPLASTMADLEVAYRILAKPNPSDPIASLFTPPEALRNPRPKVIGIYKDCIILVIRLFQSQFLTALKVNLPTPMTILAELAARAKTRPFSPSNWLQDVNPSNKILLTIGAYTPARDYLLAQQLRNLLMQHLSFLFKKHPGLIIVTPTSPIPGWEIVHEGRLAIWSFSNQNKSVRNMEYVWLANFTGLPAISCPVGYVDPKKGEGKIPVGIMGCGEWGGEETLIEFGKEVEAWLGRENEGGGRKLPKRWIDVVSVAKKSDDVKVVEGSQEGGY
ncbi:hypothetical protein DID88_002854 [Monilinia fructigena]|uniref:Amidase domain-containing protein n=1 Tax=Monilinia fructigena TaxID=38457 RepID=A0A395INR9_9HELO|nr:hypothetical protein DID88_002854 [Monilinia fructigena]